MWSSVRSFFDTWVDRPSSPSRKDMALGLGFAALAIVELFLRRVTTHTLFALLPTLVVAGALVFRRTHPFPAHATAFGVTIAGNIALGLAGAPADGFVTQACILLFPYALLRRGTARDAAAGLTLVGVTYALSAFAGELRNAEEVIGSAVVLLFPAALGALARSRADAERRAVEHAQMHERAVLARELHDTVAHHIAAIAVQAQGGRALLATKPEAAARALETIEDEATRALTELRTLVGGLRDAPADLAPRAGLSDLDDLTRLTEGSPLITVQRADLTGIAPSVAAAVHRIAREAVTNALRHAQRATRIEVHVTDCGDTVQLLVEDDGEPSAMKHGGFGLIGMQERAALLGGTLASGPGPERGWLVSASIPKRGRP